MDNAPSTADIHWDIVTDFHALVGAIGFFVKDGSSPMGVLKVTHAFSIFPGTPGVASPFRGRTMGYVGDVVGEMDVERCW
jgi:hypothetical protein